MNLSSNESHTSTISSSSLRGIIERLKSDRVRNSTRQNYYSVWKVFNKFFIKLDQKPKTWEERILLFAGYLAEKNKKSNTIKSYVSAIKAVLRDDGIEIEEDRFLLSAITKGVSYHNDCIHTRLPIQKGVLCILVKQLSDMFETQPYLESMYKALFVTAYFGLFRVGELTKGDHPVCAKDVHIADNKRKLMFILHTSKTHSHNHNPQIIKINST